MIQTHNPALTMPGVESVSLKLLPLGHGDQVALHPYQGLVLLPLSLLGPSPDPEHFSCQIGLADVGTDSGQVLCVEHWSFATAPESYSIGWAPEPSLFINWNIYISSSQSWSWLTLTQKKFFLFSERRKTLSPLCCSTIQCSHESIWLTNLFLAFFEIGLTEIIGAIVLVCDWTCSPV